MSAAIFPVVALLFYMSVFDKFIERSIEKTAAIIGESFIVGGLTISGIMEELEMDVANEIYGDTETATAEIVFASAVLPDQTYTGMKIKRLADGARYKVLSFNSSTEHYTFRVKRLGKQSLGT
jgi:hypothetical protein